MNPAVLYYSLRKMQMDNSGPISDEERERLIEEAFSEIDKDVIRAVTPTAIREQRRAANHYHEEPRDPPRLTPMRRPSDKWSLVKIVFWTALMIGIALVILYAVQIVRTVWP